MNNRPLIAVGEKGLKTIITETSDKNAENRELRRVGRLKLPGLKLIQCSTSY